LEEWWWRLVDNQANSENIQAPRAREKQAPAGNGKKGNLIQDERNNLEQKERVGNIVWMKREGRSCWPIEGQKVGQKSNQEMFQSAAAARNRWFGSLKDALSSLRPAGRSFGRLWGIVVEYKWSSQREWAELHEIETQAEGN